MSKPSNCFAVYAGHTSRLQAVFSGTETMLPAEGFQVKEQALQECAPHVQPDMYLPAPLPFLNRRLQTACMSPVLLCVEMSVRCSVIYRGSNRL